MSIVFMISKKKDEFKWCAIGSWHVLGLLVVVRCADAESREHVQGKDDGMAVESVPSKIV